MQELAKYKPPYGLIGRTSYLILYLSPDMPLEYSLATPNNVVYSDSLKIKHLGDTDDDLSQFAATLPHDVMEQLKRVYTDYPVFGWLQEYEVLYYFERDYWCDR